MSKAKFWLKNSSNSKQKLCQKAPSGMYQLFVCVRFESLLLLLLKAIFI